MIGAARTNLELHDLSDNASVSAQLGIGIVIDSERGPIDETRLITSKSHLNEIYGKVDTAKYGLSQVSAKNALSGTSQLYVRRVNKGQLFATALVKSKIEPAQYIDKYGFWIDQPKVDTIISAGTSLSLNEISSYQFPQYPNKRVAEKYPVPVTLVKDPRDGDTVFWVDNVAKVKEGDILTFVNPDEMTRDESMQFLIYPVVKTEKKLLTESWLEIEGIKQDGKYLVGKEVKKYKVFYLDRGDRVVEVKDKIPVGEQIFAVKQDGDKIEKGDFIRFSSHDKDYEVMNVNRNVITLYEPVEVEVEEDSVIKFKTEQAVSYQSIVKVESGWTAEFPKNFKVTENDIVLDGDTVEIDGNIGKVLRKYNTQNYTNCIETNTQYVDQTNGSIISGCPVYKLIETDFEFRDSFLIIAKTPGTWGNDLSVTITPSVTDEDQFVITVYEKGLKVYGEEYEVSMNWKLDGYGRQMFIEEVVNNRSSYIQVIANQSNVDENGQVKMPLFNDYYLRQKIAPLNYTRMCDTVETVYDGDVKLTVDPADISKITVDKPIRFMERIYGIASLVASYRDGPIDTIVLEDPVQLGMEQLPFSERYAPKGTPIYQSVQLQDKYDISIESVKSNTPYWVKIFDKEYLYHSRAKPSELLPILRNPDTGIIVDKTTKLYWGDTDKSEPMIIDVFDGNQDHLFNVLLEKVQSFNDLKNAILDEIDNSEIIGTQRAEMLAEWRKKQAQAAREAQDRYLEHIMEEAREEATGLNTTIPEKPLVQNPNAAMVQNPDAEMVPDPNAPLVQNPEAAMIKDPNWPKIQNPNAATIKDPSYPKIQNPDNPDDPTDLIDDPDAPEILDPNDLIEDPNAPEILDPDDKIPDPNWPWIKDPTDLIPDPTDLIPDPNIPDPDPIIDYEAVQAAVQAAADMAINSEEYLKIGQAAADLIPEPQLPPRETNGLFDLEEWFEFDGTMRVTIARETKIVAVNTTECQFFSEVADVITDRIVDKFQLDDPIVLDKSDEEYNTEESVLLGISDAIKNDFQSEVLVSDMGNFIRLTSKAGGVPLKISVSPYLELEHIQKYARASITQPVERVQGSVLPTADVGATVLLDNEYYYIVDAGTNRAGGGDDDWFPTAGNYINSLEAAFNDPDSCPNVAIILQGGINSIPYVQAIKDLCERRKDILGIGSIPFDSQAARTGITGELQYRSDVNLNTDAFTVYTPWVNYYDADNDVSLWIPPDSAVAVCLARQDNNGETYMPPAGWNRGMVSTDRLYKNYVWEATTGGEFGELYNRQINALRFNANKGICIWGQKTSQVRDSALTRINVKLTTIFIMKSLRNYLDNQTFEINNAETRARHKMNIEGFMSSFVTKGAISSYKVVCDESNNSALVVSNYELYVDVFITPVYSSEVITGRLVITREGASIA